MRFLYHEYRSNESIEEARGHTDSMETQRPKAGLVGKERITKYKIKYNHSVLVPLFVCPWNSEW